MSRKSFSIDDLKNSAVAANNAHLFEPTNKPPAPEKKSKYNSVKVNDPDGKVLIGIDPGVNTGLAIWDRIDKKYISIGSYPLHHAFEMVKSLFREGVAIFVRVEDARQRKWFGNSGREKLQGAGSAKRDAKIWDDFLKDSGIPYEMVPPKNNTTKLSAEQFTKYTGWEGRTNEHGRDAAMLVFKF